MLSTDVVSAPYAPPISRPGILLLNNDIDGDGAVLGNGQDYEETDTTDPVYPTDFKVDVNGINGSKSDVHIRYGVNSQVPILRFAHGPLRLTAVAEPGHRDPKCSQPSQPRLVQRSLDRQPEHDRRSLKNNGASMLPRSELTSTSRTTTSAVPRRHSLTPMFAMSRWSHHYSVKNHFVLFRSNYDSQPREDVAGGI